MEIFIADVTDDYRLSKNRLIKKLQDQDAKVYYQLPPPYKKDLHDNVFNTTISSCDVSVHILSQYPGRTFEDPDDLYISIHQASVGLNQNNRKIFWMPKTLDLGKIDESSYRQFLSTIPFGFADEDNVTLLKGDPQTLHEDIVNAIPFSHKSASRHGTLIVHHAKDDDHALRIRNEARKRNIDSQYNSSGDDNPSASLKLLTDQLGDVENAVVVVGAVNHEWANERTKHILSTLIQMEDKLNSIGFYFAPGARPFPFNGRFIPIKTLDETTGPQEKPVWDTFLLS